MIIPAGKETGNSVLGKIYEDKKGKFFLQERSLDELIEGIVTNGRGYIEIDKKNWSNIPYAEHPMKEKINPEIWCYRRMQTKSMWGFLDDLKEGHPN